MTITPTCGVGNFAGSGRYSAPLAAPENCTYMGASAAANVEKPTHAPAKTMALTIFIMAASSSGKGLGTNLDWCGAGAMRPAQCRLPFSHRENAFSGLICELQCFQRLMRAAH